MQISFFYICLVLLRVVRGQQLLKLLTKNANISQQEKEDLWKRERILKQWNKKRVRPKAKSEIRKKGEDKWHRDLAQWVERLAEHWAIQAKGSIGVDWNGSRWMPGMPRRAVMEMNGTEEYVDNLNVKELDGEFWNKTEAIARKAMAEQAMKMAQDARDMEEIGEREYEEGNTWYWHADGAPRTKESFVVAWTAASIAWEEAAELILEGQMTVAAQAIGTAIRFQAKAAESIKEEDGVAETWLEAAKYWDATEIDLTFAEFGHDAAAAKVERFGDDPDGWSYWSKKFMRRTPYELIADNWNQSVPIEPHSSSASDASDDPISLDHKFGVPTHSSSLREMACFWLVMVGTGHLFFNGYLG
eukprot:gnl/MRDRNA2_/MRDRNA2_96161_c0_seq1.p1 gnl/MRDRNA2_/MRDRNA2_96161_c0~~gnl/MRDRNA2_/MRDRNA2_96161_c0_seq1.p1  ORF type:complete len:359 (-),score=80.66 gnl/MRDRNA2_/MRDRNA2_96161_c0_seq1:70-1146(-)